MTIVIPPIDPTNFVPDYLDQAMEALAELMRESRNRAYFVKRGPIIWENFPFNTYRRACSIGVDHAQLFGAGGEGQSIPEAVISLEMAARLDVSMKDPSMDDRLQAEFRSDAREAIYRLAGLTNDVGDAVILRFDWGSAIGEEFSSADLSIQGLLAQFALNV